MHAHVELFLCNCYGFLWYDPRVLMSPPGCAWIYSTSSPLGCIQIIEGLYSGTPERAKSEDWVPFEFMYVYGYLMVVLHGCLGTCVRVRTNMYVCAVYMHACTR